MSNYQTFAKFYDVAMGDQSGKISFLQDLIIAHAPEAKSVLELACGTGTMLEGLSKKYDVSGVDLSPEMADIARKKLPDADIRIGDMADFSFGKKFDVVLCVFDSINHLSIWQQWCDTFDNAHKHLSDNGIFIFDFNTIERLDWLSNDPPYGRIIGDDYMFMDVVKEANKFVWDIRVFQKEADARFSLHQDAIDEVSFPVDQVKDEVSKLFAIEKVADFRNNPESDPNWRPFLVCRKK